jgi:diaminohydroxyphosphoribosylaminopyrimidine deaminase/5-amino-6-(5-phosphoribosylamino)uracil reductase
MYRAIELAKLGAGKVSPNPMVGCVIVNEGKIVGEGFHKIYGGPHAEVIAISSVKDPSTIKESDVYVSLEPCSHHGKTPPCTDLLIKYKVKQVYISCTDPNPLVSWKGIQRLKGAGIDVVEGILEEEGILVNKRFFTFQNKKRPYVILKWAQTADNFIARENFDSKWISNEYSRQLVHRWRVEEDAIMVGANTAIHDNPRLSARDWIGKDPIRILIDPNLKVPKANHLFDRTQKTIIYNHSIDQSDEIIDFVKLEKSDFLKSVFNDLHRRNIMSVMVEGGAFLINKIVTENLWDEARVFRCNKTFGRGIKTPDLIDSYLVEKRNVFDDELLFFKHI